MNGLPHANPFSNLVVADAHVRPAVDVPGIHESAFAACLDAVEQVRRARESASVLIYGEPGSGKTHLLTRLRAHLEHKSLGSLAGMANVVAVRFKTSPGRLWRHLREQVADDLQEEIEGHTCLNWLLAARLYEKESLPLTTETRPLVERWLAWLQQPDRTDIGLEAFLDETIRDRDLHTVLRHLALGRHVRDAWYWLRGNSLADAALADLQVAPDPFDDPEEAEGRARDTVFALCRMAGPVPFVFCFDQIEALVDGASGRAALKVFGRVAAELHDGVPNVVLVSCIQTGELQSLHDQLRIADRDRILKREVPLEPLTSGQGEELVRRRLESVAELQALRAGRTDLWPLDRDTVLPLVHASRGNPRKLLAHCRDLYDRARGLAFVPPVAPAPPSPPAPAPGAAAEQPPAASPAAPPQASPAPPAPVAAPLPEFLAQEYRTRLEAALARDTSDEADAILQSALPEALRIAHPEVQPLAADDAPDLDFIVAGPSERIGISLCNQRNMTSLAGKLRRLRKGGKEKKLPADRLVLLRHPRLPVSKTARQAQSYLKDLEAMGARLQQPSPEAFAALAVLRDLLADARSGDLDHDGDTVAPASVAAWLAANLPAPLTDLTEDLLAAPPPGDDPYADLRLLLADWLAQHPVGLLREAAAHLGRTPEDVETCARASPGHCGLLAGPPAVLYRYVPEALTPDDAEA